MANKNIQSIKPGTPEMEQLLQAGYPFTIEEAERVVKARTADPNAVPYERFTAAQAMLAAYKATPIAIDKNPGWQRKPHN